jgi:large subunit ribosomal protein L24
MAKLNVRKGDQVLVIAGKDKGKKGKILEAYPSEGRVLVEGVNIIKRHTRPNQANPQGGIVEREAPIHASNVMILDPKTGEPTRIGKKILKDGQKVRYAKKSGEILDK